MNAYKLTDKNGMTRNDTQWGENVAHETNGQGELCGPGWLHYYIDPLLAVLMNPVHAQIDDAILWEANAEGDTKDDRQLKYGCTKLTTLHRIPLPSVTITQRVAFGILCSLEVCDDEQYRAWADNWLSGKDRTERSASSTAWVAAWSASSAMSAAWAARAAAWATDAAASASAASAEAAAEAASAAADAADAAAWAAWATARAAAAEAASAASWAAQNKRIDLPKIAEQAMKIVESKK